MSLREYQRKRNFRRTAEPPAKVAKRKGLSYVVQKHAASRLHYDFRLELDGALKSWAVPKGPSLDPAVRRLAAHVEDHPVEYGQFEGVIPAGEYGRGTVLLWDRGTWEPVGDPGEGYRSGKLKFRLLGEKLQGGWMLVKGSKSASGKGNEWLLIKERDEEARPADELDILEEQPHSVVSGRDLKQIANDRDKVWQSNRSSGRVKRKRAKPTAKSRRRKPMRVPPNLPGAKRAAMPPRVDVKLATLAKEAPEGDQWLHEIKFDGYRIIARLVGGKVEFISRNHKSWTKRLGTLADHVAQLPAQQAILDGEVVAIKPDGTTDFQALQNAFKKGQVNDLVYYVFDLLHLGGTDLRNVPLEDRKNLLKKLLPASQDGRVRYTEHIVGNGPPFFKRAGELGLEGIICKLRDRPYGRGRGTDWLKVKISERDEFVIGGFTDPGNRSGFGALLLGYHDAKHRLLYAGKVGTGFSDTMLVSMRERLEALRQEKSPFADLRKPTGDARSALWVRPRLVGQVAFTEWTSGGHLRHPTFLGLREDKAASLVVRDAATDTDKLTMSVPSHNGKASKRKKGPQLVVTGPAGEGILAGVRVTSPEKLLFPEAGITKLELAQYYLSIERWILPHVADRPLAILRCPEGVSASCFFQKHPGAGMPETIRRIPVQEKAKTRDYVVVDKVEDLIALAQIGSLEIHVWGSRADKLEFPDRMVFDLDPDATVPWPRVVKSAHQLRSFLEEIGLKSFVKTTGGKGLHIVVPLSRRNDWDEVKGFSKQVAELIEQADPRHFTANMSKAQRHGKIFIDYLRNGRGATTICTYSTRATPQATVSVPLSWDELTPAMHSDEFTIRNLPDRLNSLKIDPWAKIASIRQSLSKAVKNAIGFDGP